jgi:hypothetical protein
VSRGFGKRQREILEALADYEAYYLASLATTDAEAKAYHRAACQLEKNGHVQLVRYSMSMYHRHKGSSVGGPKLVVLKPDANSEKLVRDKLEEIFYTIRSRKVTSERPQYQPAPVDALGAIL